MGNLLLCKTQDGESICKISDLEYARPHLLPVEADSQPHGHKTVSWIVRAASFLEHF